MIAKRFVELPKEGSAIKDGMVCMTDEGTSVTAYIDRHEETYQNEYGDYEQVVVGYPIRVRKPVSRAAFINEAEMQAYGLRDAQASAAFAASLSRKYRENHDDEEVKEHDEFIAWVKQGLTDIGV